MPFDDDIDEDFQYGGYTSTGFGKPDGSTPQRRGDWNKTVKSAPTFPYDRQTSYGQPMVIGMDGQGMADVSKTGQQLTPKDTRHTPWDDDTGELKESFDIENLFNGQDDPLDPEILDVFLDSLRTSDNPHRDIDRYAFAIGEELGVRFTPRPGDREPYSQFSAADEGTLVKRIRHGLATIAQFLGRRDEDPCEVYKNIAELLRSFATYVQVIETPQKLGEACRYSSRIGQSRLLRRHPDLTQILDPNDYEWSIQAGGWIVGRENGGRAERVRISPSGGIYTIAYDGAYRDDDDNHIVDDPSFNLIDTFDDEFDENGKYIGESIDRALVLLEASGTPYMLGKASNTPGSSTGTIPGTSGGWANAPFGHKVDDDDIERAGRKHESAWDGLADGMGAGGMDLWELEMDSAKQDFRSLFDETIDDEPTSEDLMTIMIDVDPEYVASNFSPEDDDEMMSHYLRWGDVVAGDDI